jgi:hypothetical protein
MTALRYADRVAGASGPESDAESPLAGASVASVASVVLPSAVLGGCASANEEHAATEAAIEPIAAPPIKQQPATIETRRRRIVPRVSNTAPAGFTGRS